MGILDEIKKMRDEGRDEQATVQALKERGVSPKEIDDAFNQMKIKNAVSKEELQPPQNIQAQNKYVPQTQEISEQMYYPQEETPKEFYPQENSAQVYSPQENYGDYPQYSGGIDSDTMIEIAEQVFFEKSRGMQKQMESINEIKTLMQERIKDLSERMIAIESVISRLQTAILEKVGSYGENLESIKKEMNMMQGSFGKIVNQIADNSQRKPQFSDDNLESTPQNENSAKPMRKRISK